MEEKNRIAVGADFGLAIAKHAGACRLEMVSGCEDIRHFVADMMHGL